MKIGVMGAGVMGGGIAQVLALSGHSVTAVDVSPAVLDKTRQAIENGKYGLGKAVQRGKITAAESDAARARLTLSTEVSDLADAQVVVEAVPERLDVKIAVFRQLDEVCGPETVLASNSSGFPIVALAAATNRPDKVIGWHWASPVAVMKLAEIVRTETTADQTVETIRTLAADAGKNPVVINDTAMAWGYVANRVYAAMLVESHRIMRDGVATPEQIDQLLVDCFRWPVGPFAMGQGAARGFGDGEAGSTADIGAPPSTTGARGNG